MINIKEIQPLFTKILCTADEYEEVQFLPGTTIVDTEKKPAGLKEYQTVIAVGNEVTTLKPGDVVMINPRDYMVRKYNKDSLNSEMNDVYNPVIEYQFDMPIINGEKCLLLKERDIDYIILSYEAVDNSITIKPEEDEAS